MEQKTYRYQVLIKETYLDVFGHMNNAMYLTLYEEARWDIITKNGYGLDKILKLGLGPVLLEAKVIFLKEIRLRDEIVIETQFAPYERKLGKIMQKMIRSDIVCSTGEFTVGFFNLKERKLEMPTAEWLKAAGN